MVADYVVHVAAASLWSWPISTIFLCSDIRSIEAIGNAVKI